MGTALATPTGADCLLEPGELVLVAADGRFTRVEATSPSEALCAGGGGLGGRLGFGGAFRAARMSSSASIASLRSG